MYKLEAVTKQELVQHCDNCDISYMNTVTRDWCSFTGTFGMKETAYNLHFHFCSQSCVDHFKITHERLSA